MTSTILLNSRDLKSLLVQLPKPFPQPTLRRIEQLAGLVEQVNIKAESLQLSFKQIAAEYFVRTCVGHKLLDGNKRAAVVLLEAFYTLNKKDFPFTEEEVATYVVLLAELPSSEVSVTKKIAFFRELL